MSETIEEIVRGAGYPDFICDMIIEQYNPDWISGKDFKRSPLVRFNDWLNTKEGDSFWFEIHDNPTDLNHCLSVCKKYGIQLPHKEQEKELVDHPGHYKGKDNPYEVRKVISDWNLNFNLGNVVKYIGRLGQKDDEIQELKKARNYIDFEIERIENLKAKE